MLKAMFLFFLAYKAKPANFIVGHQGGKTPAQLYVLPYMQTSNRFFGQ